VTVSEKDFSPSTKLQFARMPYVPFDDCIRQVPDNLARYITGDKFCAGNINGKATGEDRQSFNRQWKYQNFTFS
jgi:hypothetical protein